MPTTLQFRRGNNTQNNSFTGAAGEITFDTTNKTLRVHDASTAGGTRLATFAEVQALQAANALDSDIIKAITNNELKLLDSARATSLIDSAYVQARVTAGTDSDATIALIDEHALDSGRATSLIDSAYINARTDANIDSSALITLVENELKLLDSNRGNALIDTRVNASFINNLTIDADTLGGQNSAFYRAYGNLTGTPTIPSLGNNFVDSAEALKIVDANALDSGRGAALIDARVNATFINNLIIDADTLGGQNSAYHLNYNNFTNTPTIPGFGTDFIDSSTANTLADARIAANLIDEDNFASNSNSRAPSQQSVKAFIDAYVGELIDEDNMGSNSASRPPSQQSVKAYVDAEVAGVVDAAPGALNTLNELAAALNDDANFSTTVTNSIATKATLAEAQAVDPKLGTDFVDSAETLKLIDANALDSGRGNALIDARVNATFINNLTIDADTLGGQNSAYYRAYSNLTGTPTIPSLGNNFVDSAATIILADARIANNIIDEDNMASNSATRAPSQQSVKAFVNTQVAGVAQPSLGNNFVDSAEALKLIDANALDSARAISLITVPKFGTDFIDSATANTLADARIANNIIDEDNFSTNSATRAPSQQSVKAYVDANAGSTLTVQEEGSSLSTAATTLNFVGSNVTASGTGTTKTITITGSGGIALSDLSVSTTSASGGGSLSYDNSTGVFTFAPSTNTGGGDVVDDTTPQLGGNLDAQTNNITNVGKLGIGTTSVGTDFSLHVEKSGENNVLITGDTSTLGTRLTLKNTNTAATAYNQIEFADAGGQSTSSITGYNTNQSNNHGDLAFSTRDAQGSPPAERIRIKNDGKVGIGTSSPSQALDVVGNIAVSGTVDGRDVATDGTKLDGIATGATANANTDALSEGSSNLYFTNTRALDLINANALDSARALLVAETEFSVTTANGGVYKFTGDGFPSQSGDNPTLYFTRGKRYVIHNSSYGAHPLYIKTTPGTGTGNQYASGTAGQGTVKVTFDVPMDAPTTLYYQCSAHSAMRGSIVILSDASAVDSAQVTGIVDSDYVNIRSLKGLSVTTASASGGGSLAYNNVTGVFTFAPSTNSGGGGGSSLTVQDEGSALSTAATTLNFVGSGVTASGTGATKTITISGGGGSSLAIKDEGSTLSTDATTLNFVGAGVTASGTGAEKTITISGGGGGGSGGSGLTKHTYFATAGQTQFSGADADGTSLAFDAGTINVYHNGIQLRAVNDYIESAGTNRITFTQPVDLDDIVVIDKFSGGGGTSWQSLKTSSYTAEAGEGVLTNTTGGAFAVNLPANPSAGDEVKVVDAYGIAGTNNVTIGRNNSKIHGADSDFILDINRAAVSLVYVDGTQGWVVTEK